MADIDELKATFEQVVAAICRRDAGAYSGFWHEQIVAFPPFSPFAVEGKATLRKPLRCQPMKVLGVTTVNALRQSNQRLSHRRVKRVGWEVRRGLILRSW